MIWSLVLCVAFSAKIDPPSLPDKEDRDKEERKVVTAFLQNNQLGYTLEILPLDEPERDLGLSSHGREGRKSVSDQRERQKSVCDKRTSPARRVFASVNELMNSYKEEKLFVSPFVDPEHVVKFLVQDRRSLKQP